MADKSETLIRIRRNIDGVELVATRTGDVIGSMSRDGWADVVRSVLALEGRAEVDAFKRALLSDEALEHAAGVSMATIAQVRAAAEILIEEATTRPTSTGDGLHGGFERTPDGLRTFSRSDDVVTGEQAR